MMTLNLLFVHRQPGWLYEMLKEYIHAGCTRLNSPPSMVPPSFIPNGTFFSSHGPTPWSREFPDSSPQGHNTNQCDPGRGWPWQSFPIMLKKLCCFNWPSQTHGQKNEDKKYHHTQKTAHPRTKKKEPQTNLLETYSKLRRKKPRKYPRHHKHDPENTRMEPWNPASPPWTNWSIWMDMNGTGHEFDENHSQ